MITKTRRITTLPFLLALIIASASMDAQAPSSEVAGTWRALDALGPSTRWDVVLRESGGKLTGFVSNCLPGEVGIYEGAVAGDSVTFKCRGGNGLRALVFTGRLTGDELTLTWRREALGFPLAPDAMFGGPLSSQLVLKRVPAADGRAVAAQGRESSAAVSIPAQDLKLEGRLFVADATLRVRAVIVVPRWGAGDRFYSDGTVRRVLAEGESAGILRVEFSTLTQPISNTPRYDSADALAALLDRIAQEAGRPEVRGAPVLFWAHSAGGGVGPAFASRHPERTIGFVRYHSGGGMVVDATALSAIPALLLKGGMDQTALGDAEMLWRTGRTAGAPWTFSLDPDATHGGEEPFVRSQALTIPWMTAVLRLRVPLEGGTLRRVSGTRGWLVNHVTGESADATRYQGPAMEASWLPDDASVRGWRALATGGR